MENLKHLTRDKVAEILPDEQIDPFYLYESATSSPVVLSVPHGGWQYPESLVNADNFKRCISLADTGSSELGTMLAKSHFPVLIASCGRAACDLNRPQCALDGLLCAEANMPLPFVFKHMWLPDMGHSTFGADKQPHHIRMLGKAQWQSILDR